jgi:ABC-2 type transport system ATP-binding protein
MTTQAPAAIEVAGLTKAYGRQQVVNDVSFTVRPGSVTGFLGPNGAGKSTTLRILVGLASASSGHVAVLGGPYTALPNPGRRVGALVMGLPARQADEMLDRVGLSPAEGRRRIGSYSLGMRQRLGIGHALLGDPELLILDEPANGLDPAGIHWMRTMLRDFADRGGAVLLSSHLLREIEVIADHLVIIGGGRVLADGTREELLAGPDGGLEELFLRLTAADAREDVTR